MDKERLKRLYEEIKNIKEENEGIVGTRDAWKLITENERLEILPAKISSGLNSILNSKFPQPCYKATPERVVGMMTSLAFDYFNSSKSSFNELHSLLSSLAESLESPDEPEMIDRFNFMLLFNKSNTKKDIKYLLPIFSQANEENISSDKDILDVIYPIIEKKYRNSGKLGDTINSLHKLQNTDWQFQLSKNNFSSFLTYQRRIYSTFYLNLDSMADRILLEKTENRLSYRRAILQHVISRFSDSGKITWEELRDLYDSSISSNKEMLEHYKSKSGLEETLDNFCGQSEERKDYHEDIIKLSEKSLKRNIFIRRLIGQEKNWIEKFIKN